MNSHTTSNRWSKWIGTPAFYQKVLVILIPMIIQQGITNFVNLLDNIMVGQLGTTSISGVAIANQLIFVYNLMVFGILAGASIYGAQYYGKGDYEGFHQTVRIRLIMGLVLAFAGWFVFDVFGNNLYEFYLGGAAETETILYAGKYMNMICWQLIPFVLVQGIGGALKDCGETKIPMVASVLAIVTNLVFNYLLIYGKCGFPEMGIVGAALATVIARYLEFAFLLFSIVKNYSKMEYLHGLTRSMHMSASVVGKMLVTGAPLFLNETFWSSGLTIINACYASRGIQTVAATNINQTVWNLFGIVCLSMGSAVGIIAGQHLGASDFEGAKDAVRKMLVLSVVVNIGIGLLIIAVSPLVPLLYQTEPEVRKMATHLMCIGGAIMPASAYCNVCYFTLRSGGKTMITFFFDCGYTWVVCIPLAWALCHFTGWSVVPIYACVQLMEVVKVGLGSILIRSGIWINNIL